MPSTSYNHPQQGLAFQKRSDTMGQEANNDQTGSSSNNGMVMGAGFGIIFGPLLGDWASFGLVIGALIGLALGSAIPLHGAKQ
jgi:hypothetical protein